MFRAPYRCRSWRHAGPCRLWCGACDFVRVRDAVSKFADWSYVVLTFRRDDQADPWLQYRQAYFCWNRLRTKMYRTFGRFRYIQTWERFQKGGCHVNLLVSNRQLLDNLMYYNDPVCPPWFQLHGQDAGFGWRCWGEPLTGKPDAIAGYLTKLARELTGAGQKGQIPLDAPRHFRRLRASRKTLPPRRKSDWTGRLVFSEIGPFLELDRRRQAAAGELDQAAAGVGAIQ
jgi:hypothetical protein